MKNSSLTGKTQLSDCVNCSPGRYCLESGNDTTTADCQAGYYCVSKAEIPNPTGTLSLIKDIKKYRFSSNTHDTILIYESFSPGFSLFCEYLC